MLARNGADLAGWQPRPRPQQVAMEGLHARLEPLAPAHAVDLFEAQRDDGERHRYLPDHATDDPHAFAAMVAERAASEDPLWFAVIDRRSRRAEGRQSFLRIDQANGVVEIGHILWGPAIARTPVATEAFFLAARHVFDDLGYRRFEWKCNDRNEASKRAARRFGMTHEGVFRQAAVVKGENRDTAWFSLLDSEWPQVRAAFERWLAPANFDAAGRQRHRLAAGANGADGQREERP